jgi:asparagine synthase (glutamine-hydrolysing)
MCGIIGQFTFFDKQVSAPPDELPARLIALMARRGPDDEGLWSDGRYCTLGFRRLAILDLSSTGHQPMLTQGGRYVIVHNGEVYNFRELRRELEQEGARFRSTGDTEVVLYALAHWGTGALSRFNGMFALGFYDTVERRLLLARDHAGIKPLYYMLTPRGLVFASQYNQILAHPWSDPLGISVDALTLYLRLGYIPAPYALLQNTHMLEPGKWLEITSEGQVRPGRFFEFPVYREPDLRGEEAFEAVDAAVTAAVRRHLVSDVPVGTFLSGGVDSPLVAAKMRAVNNDTIWAFTIGTSGDHLDESPDAIAYAREIGVEHMVEQVTPDRALDILDDVVAACGEPLGDYSMFPTLLVSRLASGRVKVILSGDGGDELFWGYAGRFASVLERVTDLFQPDGRRGARGDMKRLFDVGARHRDPRWPASIGDYYRLVRTRFSEGWLPRIFPDLPPWPADFSLFTYTGREPDETAQWLRWNEFVGFLPMILLKVDRASMYHSLEVRVPLLDKEVVEVATRVEWRSCLDVRRRLGKLPLRDALARHVRHQTWTKRGFTVPMNAWLRGPLGEVFKGVVLGRKEIVGLSINQKAVQQMFNLHLSERVNYDWGLWVLLSLALWEKQHYSARHNVATSPASVNTRRCRLDEAG